MIRPLESLFEPGSVAVVGASADAAKWGHLLARGALAGGHRRRVSLVNRRGGEILGQRVFRRLDELPAPPELVVVSVPPARFEETVDDALTIGARAIVGITAGVDEKTEAAAAARVRAGGAVLLGPNCLGVFDAAADLHLAPWIDFPAGAIGLVAQSGNLALEIGLLAGRDGLGFSRFASLGNQADLDATDLLASLGAHDATRLIALYVEDFRDGRAFARAARAAGKPVVLIAGGTNEAGARAARSHTGALVSDLAAVDAACGAAGIVRVGTPQQLVDAAKALLGGRRARGRRVAVFGDGGGHGVVAADAAAKAGLELPVLSDRTQSVLAAELPGAATTTNPVDFAGGEDDLGRFERVGRILLASGEVDALLLTGYFGGYGDGEVEVATALADAAATHERTLVVHTLFPDSAAAAALGVPVYREIERAAQALGILAAPSRRGAVPDLPEARSDSPGEGYFAARAAVAAAGVVLSEARPVHSCDEALSAAADLGYPVVLKALGQAHKSDAGGVVLGIAGPGELVRAYESLSADEWSVERMERTGDGFELIVGVKRDPRFGPVLLVGAGGLYAELLRDTAVALAPVEPDSAEELLRSLACAPILDGARGRPPLDVDAAARAASALSQLAAATPAIAEVEVNPLVVTPRGAVALDARIVLRSTLEQEHS
jgi:acetate---CoA ligase (ADP-forming)